MGEKTNQQRLWVQGLTEVMGTETGLSIKGPAEVKGYKHRVTSKRTNRLWVPRQGYGYKDQQRLWIQRQGYG